MRSLILAATLVLSSASLPASAEPVQAAQPADAAAQARMALARRYFAAIHYDALMAQMSEKMVPAMMDTVMKSNPGLSETERQAIVEATIDAGRAFNVRMAEESIAVIADTFTREELQATVDFYESPVGQSIVRKTPSMIPRLTALAVKEMPQLQADMLRRLCAKLDCSKVKLPTATPS